MTCCTCFPSLFFFVVLVIFSCTASFSPSLPSLAHYFPLSLFSLSSQSYIRIISPSLLFIIIVSNFFETSNSSDIIRVIFVSVSRKWCTRSMEDWSRFSFQRRPRHLLNSSPSSFPPSPPRHIHPSKHPQQQSREDKNNQLSIEKLLVSPSLPK